MRASSHLRQLVLPLVSSSVSLWGQQGPTECTVHSTATGSAPPLAAQHSAALRHGHCNFAARAHVLITSLLSIPAPVSILPPFPSADSCCSLVPFPLPEPAT